MGREIRKVPKGWEHPRDKNGKYKPMFEEPYVDVLEEWIKNHRLWQQGLHPSQLEHPEATKECKYYAQWTDNPPNVEYYNLNKWTQEDALCFQLYETFTEGTPLSPVFTTLKELEYWLVLNQGYGRDVARKLCEKGSEYSFEGYMPSNSQLLKAEPLRANANKKGKRNRPK